MTDLQILKLSIQQLKIAGFGSQKTIGNLLGYTNESAFSQVLNGKVKIPSDLFERISQLDDNVKNFINFSRDYKEPKIEAIPRHVIPDDEAFKDNDDKFAYSDEGIEAMRVSVVPAKAQMGYLRGFADPEYYENLEFEVIPVEKEHRGTYLGFETVGYSMVNLTSEQWAEKSIFPKRVAIGRELSKMHWKSKLHMHNYDAWIIVHKTDGILLKEIIDHDVDNGYITIHSWNPDKETYPDDTLFLGDIHQLFCVVKVIDKRR